MIKPSAGTCVAFQGERGAYSELAARTALGSDIEPVPCRSFDDVFASVEGGSCDLGIVPIENSLTGSIHRNYDLLLRNALTIVGETQLRIKHCLLANPGTTLADVRIVRSHPQALAQCEHYLSDLGVEVIASYDTAGSAQALHDNGARHEAVLASALAGRVYGLEALQEEVEDSRANFTRFLLLGREPADPEAESKTSIVFALKNQPGALFRAMACFALRDVDLTKIESRPQVGSPWKYRFYMDFLGRHDQGQGKLALIQLTEIAKELRVLGSYPRSVYPARMANEMAEEAGDDVDNGV